MPKYAKASWYAKYLSLQKYIGEVYAWINAVLMEKVLKKRANVVFGSALPASMISFSSGCTIIQLDGLSQTRPLNQSNGYCKSNIVWSTEVANIQKCCSGLLGISKILWISTIQTQDSPKPSENQASSSPVLAWVRFCWASTKSMPVELGFLLWPYALVHLVQLSALLWQALPFQ